MQRTARETLIEYARSTLAPKRMHAHAYSRHDAREGASDKRLHALRTAALEVMETGEPDEIITQEGTPYMKRWYVKPRPSKRVACTFVHEISNRQPDTPHSHPWDCASIVLEGHLVEQWWSNIEEVEQGREGAVNRIEAGDIAVRPAVHTHTLQAPEGRVITLFDTGEKYNDWAFCRPNEHRMTWASLDQAWNAGERVKMRETNLPKGRPYRRRSEGEDAGDAAHGRAGR